MIERIVDAIKNNHNHSISYSRFMEMALYDEYDGYYMNKEQKIGKGGDFYTSSSVSSIFAEIIAAQLIKQIEELSLPPIIIEMGGGNGSFAKTFLEVWRKQSPETYFEGTYYIIEGSPFHQSLIDKAVADHKNVKIVNGIDDIKRHFPKFKGIIFSNEFFDAFPVEIIQKVNDRLMEVRLTESNGTELHEKLFPLTNKEIINFIHEFQVVVNEGQRYEIPLSMCSFIKMIGEWMEEGVVYTIDYGYTDKEWSLPYHKEGSLRGYYKHQLIQNPLMHIGKMDLTTHIHFDKLIKAAATVGLNYQGLYRQDEYLMKVGILDYLQEHIDTDPFSEKSKRNRAIRSLLMQGGISSSFHVVVQSKTSK